MPQPPGFLFTILNPRFTFTSMSYLPAVMQGLGTQPVKIQESLAQASLGLRARLALSSVPFPDYGIAIFHLTPCISALVFFVSFLSQVVLICLLFYPPGCGGDRHAPPRRTPMFIFRTEVICFSFWDTIVDQSNCRLQYRDG